MLAGAGGLFDGVETASTADPTTNYGNPSSSEPFRIGGKVNLDNKYSEMLMEQVHLLTAYHFGGYAKTTSALIAFMRRFREMTGILLDPVYTAKAAFAMEQEAAQRTASTPERWVLLHTGGLQGIEAMEKVLGAPIYPDC